jgi:heme oxygenase
MAKLSQQEITPAPNDVGALANRINKATHSIHNKINNLISMKMVFALRDPRIYRQGIQSFYHVFKTYEECWQEEMNKIIKKGAPEARIQSILREVWTPALTRTEPLRKDLNFYYNNDASKFEEPIMKEQIEFVQHIRNQIREKPYLALAYGHTMYLALFAGGRILRSNVMRAAGLFPQVEGLSAEEVALRGTNLFQFQVEDEDALRMGFKSRFELATRNDLTEQEKQDIIAESQEIFRRNILCVSEIAEKNKTALLQKFGYRALQTLKFVFIALLVFVVFYQLRRFLGNFI